MYAPLRIWRKWHQKSNLKQKRHAVASALAASAVTPLVQARGHRIEDVPELPLVVDKLAVEKTKNLLRILNRFGAGADLKRCDASHKLRAGVGKMRNRRYVMRKGPLVIYGDESTRVRKTARNLPGADVCHVDRLNLLQLAPGGHLGRFCIWTKDAFAKLNTIFGTFKRSGEEKKGYRLNRPLMKCADLARIINSDQVQSVVRKPKSNTNLNKFKGRAVMSRLNPFAAQKKQILKDLQEERSKKRAATIKAKRYGKDGKERRSNSKKWL